jgi:hypothetical protein
MRAQKIFDSATGKCECFSWNDDNFDSATGKCEHSSWNNDNFLIAQQENASALMER